MQLFDGGAGRREPAPAQTTPVPTIGELDELTPRPQTNLARGIVWADILADIAADEEARQQLRDAA